MKKLSLDLSKTASFVNEHEIAYMEEMVKSAHEKLHNGTGAGSDFFRMG